MLASKLFRLDNSLKKGFCEVLVIVPSRASLLCLCRSTSPVLPLLPGGSSSRNVINVEASNRDNALKWAKKPTIDINNLYIITSHYVFCLPLGLCHCAPEYLSIRFDDSPFLRLYVHCRPLYIPKCMFVHLTVGVYACVCFWLSASPSIRLNICLPVAIGVILCTHVSLSIAHCPSKCLSVVLMCVYL